jgi:hypothetical protein
MSNFNDLVYRESEEISGSNLDYVRAQFGTIFKKFLSPNSRIEVEQIGNSYLFYTGFEFEFLNLAAIYDGDRARVEEVIRKVQGWKVKNSISLAGAGLAHANLLKESGYLPSHATPFMVAVIDSRFSNFELREGLVAKRTQSEDDCKLNIKMLSDTFGMNIEWARILFDTTFGHSSTYRYLLFDRGVPVSSCLFLTHGDFVGCFDVVTPIEHQRKGYGAELMKHMLKEQAELESRFVTLQSSQAGYKLYRTLGFQVVEYQQQWKSSSN